MIKHAFFTWPGRYLPTCVTAGAFPMSLPGCNHGYSHPTVALHLHDYPGKLWIGRRLYALQPGDITFSPPHLVSRYEVTRDGTHLCLHFHPIERKPGSASIRLPYHLRLGSQTPAARERFWRVIDHMRSSGGKAESLSTHAACAALQELILWLALRQKRGAVPRRDSLAQEALQKVMANIETYLDRPASVADLAAKAGLSPSYLARLFAQRHGVTLQHYLLQRRMELARHLLIASDLLVFEIGRRVGLPDAQYFNKQFRRTTGVSPLAYRRKNSGAGVKAK